MEIEDCQRIEGMGLLSYRLRLQRLRLVMVTGLSGVQFGL